MKYKPGMKLSSKDNRIDGEVVPIGKVIFVQVEDGSYIQYSEKELDRGWDIVEPESMIPKPEDFETTEGWTKNHKRSVKVRNNINDVWKDGFLLLEVIREEFSFVTVDEDRKSVDVWGFAEYTH